MSDAPDVENVFSGQSSQLFMASSWYLPVEQVSQAEEPGMENAPGEHGVQESTAPMLYVFLGHSSKPSLLLEG